MLVAAKLCRSDFPCGGEIEAGTLSQVAKTTRYFACVVAAVLGMIGYDVRVCLGKPPVMSPIEPLAIPTALGFSELLAKYRYLKRLLQD